MLSFSLLTAALPLWGDSHRLTHDAAHGFHAAPLVMNSLSGGATSSMSGSTSCGTTERVSVATDGAEANGATLWTSISADGRFAVFSSAASNLVSDDTNGTFDVFVHDRDTGTTERVSVASDGTQGNGVSDLFAVNADGRYIAFRSFSSNLVPGDTNGVFDVFVHDRVAGITERVSVASDGTEGSGNAVGVAISGDGRYVAFASDASNLVPGDTNGARDVFVHDRETRTTERVSVASDGTQGNAASDDPAMSADGGFVTFESLATNLVPGDTNTVHDIFIHDRNIGATERASVAFDGTQANLGAADSSAVSADGRFVAFGSFSTNLVPEDDTNGVPDIFVRDRQTGVTERVSVASDGSQANGGSWPFGLAISADGRSVAFISHATNLVPDDTNDGQDVFVHDRDTGATMRGSIASDCTEGNGPVAAGLYGFGLSADGRHVAFIGTATNLVPDDTNDAWDAFVHTFPSGLAISPDPLDFGPVLLDTTRGPLSLTVANVGTEDVTVSAISDPDAPFTAQGGTCDPTPFVLAPQESCTLDFSFSPTLGPGPAVDAVTLTSDAPNSPHVVTLQGTGSEVELHIAPSFIAFGGVVVGETAGPMTETLTNAGGLPIEVSSVSVPETPFAASGGTCGDPPFSLDPFASCTLDYVCSPTEAGLVFDTVEVISDAPNSPAGFSMRCRGLVRELTVTPELLDFGPVPVGETGDALDVTLTNSGQVSVDLSGVSEPGVPFALMENTCEAVLPVGASCALSYIFSPIAPQDVSAAVKIAHNALSGPDTVILQGTGLGAVIDVEPDGLAAVLEQGQAETHVLTIANLGNAVLEWEIVNEDGVGERLLRPRGAVTVPVSAWVPVDVKGLARSPAVPDTDTSVSYPFTASGSEITLTHSESLDIQSPNTIVCSQDDGVTTSKNQFLRTFTLADFGITGTFEVTQVTFGIQNLTTRTPITVNLYTLEGEFIYANLVSIGTATQQLSAQTMSWVTVPVTGTASAGSTLVVEIDAPDLSGVGSFFPGSNNLGETAPSYIASASCGTGEPIPYTDIGFPQVHLVMTVTGTPEVPVDCALPGWVAIDPVSGSVPGGDSQEVQVVFDAADLQAGEFTAELCLDSNDLERPVIVVPLELTVIEASNNGDDIFRDRFEQDTP